MEMYAYFVINRRRGMRFWWEEVRGMPLLRVELPGKHTDRIEGKLHRALYRLGVHRVFNHPDGWDHGPLPALNATRPLWLAKAAEAILLTLEQRKIHPGDAVVELRGERLLPEHRRLITALLPRVRGFRFEMEVEEEMLWYLQREYGLSSTPCRGDISVSFSPAVPDADLPLGALRPEIPGLRLTAEGVARSGDCPLEPLLAALLEQGRLRENDIQVHEILLDIQFNNNYNAVDNVPV